MARRTSDSRSRHKKKTGDKEVKKGSSVSHSTKRDNFSASASSSHYYDPNGSHMHPKDCDCLRLRPGLFLPPNVPLDLDEDADDRA